MTKQYKNGLISVYVEASIKEQKERLGTNWRTLIIRGLKEAQGTNPEDELKKQDLITKLSTKVQQLSMKIFQLEENKEDKK